MRLLAVLLALCLATPSLAARALVVVPRTTNEVGIDPLSANDVSQMNSLREVAFGWLNTLGIEHDAVPANVAKTEFCRSGVVTYNFGTSAAYTKSYDVVIHLLDNLYNNAPLSYRPDSLFSSTKAPAVPQLIFSRSYNWTASPNCCSLSVTKSSAGYNTGLNWQGQTVYGPGFKFPRRSTNLDGYSFNGVQPSGATVRGYLFQKANASFAQEVSPTEGAPCMDCDSVLAGVATDGDTTSVFSVQHNKYLGADNTDPAQPLVVCDFAHNPFDQADPSVALMGLAIADSLVGGGLITKPLKLGIYITGGLRRGARTAWGGISPDDSTNFKASLDSLASLHVPITVGISVDPDTLSNREGDFAWYRRLGGMARYAPENYHFIGDTTLTGPAGASYTSPTDFLGRLRKRAQFGDSTYHSVMGSDSSVQALTRAAFNKLRTLNLPLDMALVPPLFDHVPLRPVADGDSAHYGVYKAGVRSVVFDVSAAASYGAQANVRTRVTTSRFARVGSTTDRIAVLGAVTLDQDSSAARWAHGLSVDAYTFTEQWGASVEHFWDSVVGARPTGADNLLSGGDASQATGRRSDVDNAVLDYGRARVFVIAASDLGSGVRSDASTRPTRPGWWAVKSIVHAAKLANGFGRTVVTFDKLESLEP